MLIISFMKLFAEALVHMTPIEATVVFVAGALLMMAIDLTTPHLESGRWETGIADPRLLKTGFVVAIGISLHNFPEGFVVSASYGHLPRLGLLIAVIVCLHNIPEGIATATPLIAAGMDGESHRSRFPIRDDGAHWGTSRLDHILRHGRWRPYHIRWARSCRRRYDLHNSGRAHPRRP